MRVEAVTICVDYDDFLAEVAPYNIPLLDRWIIVTRSSDTKTRETCRKYSLECILVDDEIDRFNKGRMIERGTYHFSAEGWRLHLDADIVLPNRFKSLLEVSDLRKDCIYGCDRIMVKSWDRWQNLVTKSFYEMQHHDYHHRLSFPSEYEIGSRWISVDVGYCPIGFFQLWHSDNDQYKGINYRKYPKEHNNACRTDVQFAQKWDRRHRILLPEITVMHLESEPSPLGKNWNGRKSIRFGRPNGHGHHPKHKPKPCPPPKPPCPSPS